MVQLADVLTKDGVEREQMHAAMRGAVDVSSPAEAYARKEASRASRAARAEVRREARNTARLRAAAECHATWHDHERKKKGRKTCNYISMGQDALWRDTPRPMQGERR